MNDGTRKMILLSILLLAYPQLAGTVCLCLSNSLPAETQHIYRGFWSSLCSQWVELRLIFIHGFFVVILTKKIQNVWLHFIFYCAPSNCSRCSFSFFITANQYSSCMINMSKTRDLFRTFSSI